MLSSSCPWVSVVFKGSSSWAWCLRCLVSVAQASRFCALLFVFSGHVDLFPPWLSCCVPVWLHLLLCFFAPNGWGHDPQAPLAESGLDTSFTDRPCAEPELVILILHDVRSLASVGHATSLLLLWPVWHSVRIRGMPQYPVHLACPSVRKCSNKFV